MSLISWNCRGLGRAQDLTVQRLLEQRSTYFPEFFFLMETMNSRNTLVDLKSWLGYDQMYTVNPVNIGGGLALFWKNSVNVNFLYADKNLLDVTVQYEDKLFNLSCVYGNPDSRLRHVVWERLSRFGVNRKSSWCSDNRPVLIKLLSFQDSYRGSFKFDKIILHKPMVREVIVYAWSSFGSFRNLSVASRLRNCRKSLRQWKKENKANSQERIIQLQDAMEQEQSDIQPSLAKMSSLRKSNVLAYRDEEIFWKQKSKDDWILFSDGNTIVFHTEVKISRAKNEVVKLIDKNGIVQRSKGSKGHVTIQYFKDLFKSSNSEDYSSLLQDLPSRK
ncbi:hypothetical protein N665_0040s0071 [Sinapis alba]|nr:hypothetical protein N665_0040s0071 [Sinapis alba]